MAGEKEELLKFVELSRRVNKDLDHFLFGHKGLSMVQVMVLRELLEKGELLSLTKLAQATDTERHNLTSLSARMYKADLIRFYEDRTDRRLTLVGLTDKGIDIALQTDALLDQAAGALLPMIRES